MTEHDDTSEPDKGARVPHPALRLLVPFAVGAAASAGAIVASLIVRERKEQLALQQPVTPLEHDGWWNSDDSSPLAYAHPTVLFIETDDKGADGVVSSVTIVDSWDRRSRGRVVQPYARIQPEWPTGARIVVDAETGDLLQTLRAPGMLQS